jgi:hypothetical protein
VRGQGIATKNTEERSEGTHAGRNRGAGPACHAKGLGTGWVPRPACLYVRTCGQPQSARSSCVGTPTINLRRGPLRLKPSSGSRIIPSPRLPIPQTQDSDFVRRQSPVTAAGPPGIHTLFRYFRTVLTVSQVHKPVKRPPPRKKSTAGDRRRVSACSGVSPAPPAPPRGRVTRRGRALGVLSRQIVDIAQSSAVGWRCCWFRYTWTKRESGGHPELPRSGKQKRKLR